MDGRFCTRLSCFVRAGGVAGAADAVRGLRRRWKTQRLRARPGWREATLWVALAAVPSALLLAITNHLSVNIAPIPLLWVVPLGVYLLSLVLCFDSDRWYDRRWWYPLLLVALAGMTYYLFPERNNTKIKTLVPIFVLGLFFCCMACHGELAHRKPAPRWLTYYYLMLAAGGALGGLFVAVVAPLLFTLYLELPLALLACAILVTAVIYGGQKILLSSHLGRMALGAALGIALALGYLLTVSNYRWLQSERLVARNFYGQSRVEDNVDHQEQVRHLLHGTILHGSQLQRPELRRKAVAYYGLESGVGLAITERRARGPIRIGVIGLGVGTLATYARRGRFRAVLRD